MFDDGVMAAIRLSISEMNTMEEIKTASTAVNDLLKRRWNVIQIAKAQTAAASFHVGQTVEFDITKGRIRGRFVGKIKAMNTKTVTIDCEPQRGNGPTSWRVTPQILRAVKDKPAAAPPPAPITLTLVGGPRPVANYAEASKLVRDEITALGVGNTEWSKAEVGGIFDSDGRQIAHVSYNGRIWEGDRFDPKNRAPKEIPLSA